MIQQISEDIWTWSWYSKEKGYMFNGTIVGKGRQRVLIDPVWASDKDLEEVKALGPFEASYLTNKDHERMSYELRKKWNLAIWIHAKDRPYLKEAADEVFHEGQVLAGGLEVLHLPDQKSPGECAFYLRRCGVVILGDALIGVPAGQLNLLPAPKYKDFGKAKAGLQRLRSLFFNAILVGDGTHVLKNAHDVMEDFFFRCALPVYPERR